MFAKKRFKQHLEVLEKLKEASKAKTTREQYTRAWGHFQTWSIGTDLECLPATPLTIDLYLAEIVMTGRGVATAKMALAAISDKPISKRLESPCSDATIRQSMQGMTRTLGKPAVQAKAMKKGILKGMIHRTIGSELDGGARCELAYWREMWRETVCLSTLARFLRLQRVQGKDVISLDSQTIQVNFLTRKNDQAHVGHYGILVKNATRYCPYN